MRAGLAIDLEAARLRQFADRDVVRLGPGEVLHRGAAALGGHEPQVGLEQRRAARAEQHEAEIERQAELKDSLIESADKQREVADRQRQEYMGVTSVIAGGLNDALQAIISGNKTAEEAFTGLLASFLKYISEQSMLKAIYEYAEAIAPTGDPAFQADADRAALNALREAGVKLIAPLTGAAIMAAAWGVIMLFNLVTLPVEFDASRRALATLESGAMLPEADVQFVAVIDILLEETRARLEIVDFVLLGEVETKNVENPDAFLLAGFDQIDPDRAALAQIFDGIDLNLAQAALGKFEGTDHGVLLSGYCRVSCRYLIRCG